MLCEHKQDRFFDFDLRNFTEIVPDPFHSHMYRLPTSGPVGPRHIVAQQEAN